MVIHPYLCPSCSQRQRENEVDSAQACLFFANVRSESDEEVKKGAVMNSVKREGFF